MSAAKKNARYEITHVAGFMEDEPQAAVGTVWVDTYRGKERSWTFERGGDFSHVSGRFLGRLESGT